MDFFIKVFDITKLKNKILNKKRKENNNKQQQPHPNYTNKMGGSPSVLFRNFCL